MIQPQELEVWYILPSIRKEIAVCLKKQGLSQKQIAKMLGLSESAISQYSKLKRAKEIHFSENVKNEIKKSANKIKNKKNVTGEVQRICSLIKKRRIFVQNP